MNMATSTGLPFEPVPIVLKTHHLLGAQHDTISRIYIEYKLSAKYKERKEKRKREEKIGDKGSTYTALT